MSEKYRRRAMGQHFLKSEPIIQGILSTFFEKLSTFQPQGILEIGPGQGALTTPLLERMERDFSSKTPNIVIVERDKTFAEHWAKVQVSGIKVNTLQADFLKLDAQSWSEKKPVAVLSNLPYSASTKILGHLCEELEKISFMLLMFQAEVAQRVRANESDKNRGGLSVWVQNRWQIEKVLNVPPGAFAPPPKVDSEVLFFEPREAPIIDQTDHEPALWEQLLRTCFKQRRKMLRSNMTGPWKRVLEKAEVNGEKRAQALNWDEWKSLFKVALSERKTIGS